MNSKIALIALGICIFGMQGCDKEPATQQKEGRGNEPATQQKGQQIDKSRVMGDSDKIVVV